jgi:hypothetical protein
MPRTTSHACSPQPRVPHNVKKGRKLNGLLVARPPSMGSASPNEPLTSFPLAASAHFFRKISSSWDVLQVAPGRDDYGELRSRSILAVLVATLPNTNLWTGWMERHETTMYSSKPVLARSKNLSDRLIDSIHSFIRSFGFH